MDLGLRGRCAVVTGASGGIGGATARALAAEGTTLLLVGRRVEALTEIARDCMGAGAQRVSTLALDLTRPSAAPQVRSASVDGLGGIDVLVNCAGTTAVRTPAQLTDRDWQAQWELHVMAPMRLMRLAAPVMASRGWGRIVNVCSSSGKRPSGTNMAYSVTKAAQLSLSRGFADMYARDGVLVNAVAPGPVAGDLWLAPGGLADQVAAARGISREEALAGLTARVPRGRLGSDREIADVIAFLCSERASNVAGAAWSVDGGSVPVII
ncbi:MAG: SDR family NAD(P)-dependent oxidoreductase [Solirubrobacteraceae bacterium]